MTTVAPTLEMALPMIYAVIQVLELNGAFTLTLTCVPWTCAGDVGVMLNVPPTIPNWVRTFCADGGARHCRSAEGCRLASPS